MSDELQQLCPSDLDSEAAMIGSYLVATSDVRAEIRATCQPWMLLDTRYAAIYRRMLAMSAAGQPIDGVLIYAALKDANELVEAGGAELIGQVLQSVPSASHGKAYALRVADKAHRREIIRIAGDLRASAGNSTQDTSEVIGTALERFGRLLAGKSGVTVYSAGDLVDLVEQAITNQEEDHFVRTGLGSLDDAIAGLEPGSNTLIAARPSMGKSTLARQLLGQMAMMGTPVGLISLEESAGKVARNLVSNWASVANGRLRRPKTMALDEWERVQAAATRLRPAPLYVVDSVRRWADVEAAARLLQARHGVQVIAIDHIHLLDGFGGRSDTEKTTAASHAVKWLWKQLRLAGITVAQLNRGNEADGHRPPAMSDLRNSGELEQDADTILLLHRESYYKGSEEGDEGPTDIIVAKQRDGVRNLKITLNTVLKYCRFEERCPV